jgi:glycosyltransferase involved in cell wall biosynthesis
MEATSLTPKLLHVFPTFGFGGVQTRFVTIANHFGDAFRHVLLAMDGAYEGLQQLDSTLDIAILEVPIRKAGPFANRQRFRAALHKTKADILVTYNWGSIEWAFANWPRMVRHIHVEDGFGPEEADGQLTRRVWTRRFALRNSMVIVPSLTLQGIATSVWRLDPRRVRYIPNGIDCARFAPSGAGASPPRADVTPVIGTVATLRREKNLTLLLEAFAIVVRDMACRLVIVGDGPERQHLTGLADRLGLSQSIVFLGHVADPSRLYETFDIFALSSDTEQMPYSVLEAMAAGLPLAATDVGDVRKMVAAENDPFVVARNVMALAGVLRELLDDPPSRNRIGIANREKACREFDQGRMLSAYADLFHGEPMNRS